MDNENYTNKKNSFSERVKKVIKQIPGGKVATYGLIAFLAGNPRGARQVSWILHSCSKKDNLPWHRIINHKGRISLPIHQGYNIQKALLEKEGIVFNEDGSINLDLYLWHNVK
jgi:methylated-DNA-protein-cysteine methyltransferase-like protein